MKLATFEQRVGFKFALTFANGDRATVDLEPLIGNYISVEELDTAEIDPDWGCLQFQGGSVDIEPTTLYRYAMHPQAETAVHTQESPKQHTSPTARRPAAADAGGHLHANPPPPPRPQPQQPHPHHLAS